MRSCCEEEVEVEVGAGGGGVGRDVGAAKTTVLSFLDGGGLEEGEVVVDVGRGGRVEEGGGGGGGTSGCFGR